MVQRPDGGFVKMNQPFLDADSTYEESAATWADINADGFIDLLIADGGNEYYGKTPYLKPRVYINDQTGILKPKVDAFPDIFETQSCIETSDVDNDGDLDVFIGGKTIAWQYGNLPNSYLLINNGKGKFSDQTPNELKELGMVKAAKWVDIDADGDQDLILACQWDGIFCFENVDGKLTKRILSDKKGWWNNLYPSDIDGDGDIDFILGNLGLNSRIKGTEKEPIRMYVNDIDDNGRLDQIVTHYMAGEEVIFADKKELEKQMPFIRKKFNLSRDFADANFKDVFGKDKINSARVFEANFLENAVLINRGDWRFELKALPEIAQYSPVLAVSGVEKTNHDYLLMGNFFESNIQLGRYDAGFGGLLHFGSDSWDYSAIPKLQIRGQVRHIVPIKIKGSTHYLVARNDDVLMVLRKSSE
ncbi:MAG: VCBS repeat-containing protein [Cytophagales bacterium]|nr:VCBS repeat-containing protein [Cytophagales bacterium]